MSNLKKLEKYFPLVDFWGEVCGPAYEILLHDVSEPNHSVVKIVNNHISHREIGSPLTDLAINHRRPPPQSPAAPSPGLPCPPG